MLIFASSRQNFIELIGNLDVCFDLVNLSSSTAAINLLSAKIQADDSECKKFITMVYLELFI